MDKNIARLRRAKTTRSHIRELGVHRLSVLRSGQHIYAQVFTADGSKVLADYSDALFMRWMDAESGRWKAPPPSTQGSKTFHGDR